MNKAYKLLLPERSDVSARTIPNAPIRPVIIPAILCRSVFIPKNKEPMISTIKGKDVLSMPAKELFTSVCALANNTAGIKLPKKPTIKIALMSLRLNFFRRLNKSGIKKIEAKKMRMEPTCISL